MRGLSGYLRGAASLSRSPGPHPVLSDEHAGTVPPGANPQLGRDDRCEHQTDQGKGCDGKGNFGKENEGGKMKTFVLTISEYFLSGHPRAGEPTTFCEKIGSVKIHTIRPNFGLWQKRFSEIEAGRACLSVRQWTGKPYRSPQKELLRLDRSNGIGIQRVDFSQSSLMVDGIQFDFETVAKNDGLLPDDFAHWFSANPKESLAMIHFTDWRYTVEQKAKRLFTMLEGCKAFVVNPPEGGSGEAKIEKDGELSMIDKRDGKRKRIKINEKEKVA